IVDNGRNRIAECCAPRRFGSRACAARARGRVRRDRDPYGRTDEGVDVAKGYWINQSDVTDAAGHAVYAKAVAEYLGRRGAKTLVFSQPGGRREVVEGTVRSRQLIQEFPDYESALEAYH